VGVKRLGRIRARRLVNTFEYNLKNVSEDELQRVDGIGPKMAAAIKKYVKKSQAFNIHMLLTPPIWK